jgi:hypothetical protein
MGQRASVRERFGPPSSVHHLGLFPVANDHRFIPDHVFMTID